MTTASPQLPSNPRLKVYNLISYNFLKRARALSTLELWEKGTWRLMKTGRRLRYLTHFPRLDACTIKNIIDPALNKCQSSDDIYQLFLAHSRPRFFCNYDNRDDIATMAQNLASPSVATTVAEAEGILNNKFYVHGFGDTSFGSHVGWTGTELSYRDKLLGRHDFIPTLIQAYWYTGEPRFAEGALGLWRDWMDHSDRVSLDNSVDNSLRIQNWLWMLYGFPTGQLLEATDIVKLLSEVYRSAYYIEANMLYAGNHRVIEALGLWCIGMFFPELRRAKHWRMKGARILSEEIKRQVFEDGVHMEMSSGYHVFVTVYFLKYYILSLINDYVIRNDYSYRLIKMLEFVETLRKPDGELPMLGDSDALTTIDREHRESKLLAPALSFLKTGELFMSKSCGDLVPWYFGGILKRPSTPRLNFGMPTDDTIPCSRLLPNSGYVVLRTGYGSTVHYMLMDAGPFGMESLGHHGHADALHVEICTSGKSLVIDPGGYAYVKDQWREFFRSTRAHSTVEVDGQNQSELFGVFGTGRTARSEIVTWFSNDKVDFVEAFHDGYQSLSLPVIHRRAIIFIKKIPSYWIIIDRLEGSGEHTLDLLFHLSPDVKPQTDGAGKIIIEQSKACSAAIRSLNHPPDIPNIISGQLEPHIQGWVSRTTGLRRPAAVISFQKRAILPQLFTTLVQPEYSPHEILSIRRATFDQRQLSWELTWANGAVDNICITDQEIDNRPGRRMIAKVERRDARQFIWCECCRTA